MKTDPRDLAELRRDLEEIARVAVAEAVRKLDEKYLVRRLKDLTDPMVGRLRPRRRR